MNYFIKGKKLKILLKIRKINWIHYLKSRDDDDIISLWYEKAKLMKKLLFIGIIQMVDH